MLLRTPHLSHSDDAASLPLFADILHQHPIECDDLSPLGVYHGTSIEALALNRDMLELHHSERIEDTGLRFLVGQ